MLNLLCSILPTYRPTTMPGLLENAPDVEGGTTDDAPVYHVTAFGSSQIQTSQAGMMRPRYDAGMRALCLRSLVSHLLRLRFGLPCECLSHCLYSF